VHRDLKPSNILLRSNGQPVLTDLGIALSTNEARLTQTNKMIGTPDYMSPEQAIGGDLDGRSDIYSLGIMLYELLCGRRPFSGDSAWLTIHKQINETPPPLETIRTGLSPQLYAIVNRCLQKEPADRYQTAQELIDALNDAIKVQNSSTIGDNLLRTISLEAAGVVPPSASFTAPARSTVRPGSSGTQSSADSAGPSWWLLGGLGGLVVLIGGIIAYLLFAPPPEPIRITAEVPIAIAPTDTPTSSAEEVVLEPTSTRAPETDTPTATAIVVVVTNTPEPTEVPTETAPPTSTTAPTNTPTDSPTSSSTEEDEPEAASTPSSGGTGNNQQSNPSVLATGNGLPIGFEDGDIWGIGQEKNGTFFATNQESHSGSRSGRLDYDFDSDGNDYVVFLQLNAMSGTPNSISAWVYGDGSGHFANAWIRDSEQQIWQVPLGQVFHTGWQEMTGAIQVDQAWPWTHISGPNNNEVDYPINFYAFVLDDYNADYEGSGTIYVDDIQAQNQSLANVPTVQPQNPTPTTSSGGSSPTATPDSQTAETESSFSGTVGRIIYTAGDKLFTADPNWSSPEELGVANNSSCSGSPTLTTGQSFNAYRGFFCSLASPTLCTSPNGQKELVINIQGNQMTINVRNAGDTSTNGEFIYEGSVDKAEGMRWAPDSQSYVWVSGDTMFRGFAEGGFQQLYGPVYNPIISPDSQTVLYRKPVGPGVNDVWVANLDGTGETNITNDLSIDKSCAVWASP
ncbi:MAG: protein kinase, partial [Chloroflexota bacterium]